MSCGYSEERLALYMDSSDEDLPLAETHDINRHLASCATCRAILAKLRENQVFAKTLRADTVNSDVLNGLHQRVMVQVADLKRSPEWMIQLERFFFSGMRRKYALAGFGSLALVCCLALGILSKVHKRADTTPETQPVPAPLVAAVSDLSVASVPERIEPQPATVHRVKRTPNTETVPAAPLPSNGHPRQIMVKLYTDDPSVVIYWSLDGNGEAQ